MAPVESVTIPTTVALVSVWEKREVAGEIRSKSKASVNLRKEIEIIKASFSAVESAGSYLEYTDAPYRVKLLTVKSRVTGSDKETSR